MKLKKFGVILTIVLWIATLVISFFVGMTYHWASTTEIKTTKDYSQIVVEENDVVDYKIFLEIPKEYSALEQIEEPIRKTISLYMQANNLKLSEGTHEFTQINGNLDEYINQEFRFEKITENSIEDETKANADYIVEVPISDVETIVNEQENGIMKQEAESLCREILGDKAEENGFPISYRCISAVSANNKLYYVMHITWLVDNNHWSYIGNCFVSSDGREIYDGIVSPSKYKMTELRWKQ